MSIPEILKCKEWRGVENFPDGEIDKYIIGGIEEINNDLKDHAGWNGTKPVGTIVLGSTGHGQVTSTFVHLLGETPDKYIDAKNLWENVKVGSHVKITPFDLSTVIFRGSLCSAYMSSTDFPWTLRVPSKSRPGSYHDIDKDQANKYGVDTNLWLRVLAQPWLNGCIKISAGLAAIDDITELSNHMDFQCPLVEIFSLTIPLLPRPDQDVSIPCVPYILDERPDKSGDFVTLTSKVVITTVNSIFKNKVKPNLKKSPWEKARNEDWDCGELCSSAATPLPTSTLWRPWTPTRKT